MTPEYILMTDSACDMKPETLREWKVETIRLGYMFQESGKAYLDNDQAPEVFYKAMREGQVAKTSSINESSFTDFFRPALEKGMDILYLAFSGGLSVTADNARKVAAAMEAEYPGRRVRVIDSLCASGGQGLFVYVACRNRDQGMNLEENAAALEKDLPHMCHWFTVEDLKYLKRGGRVSAATALLGTALNVKPVLHVDDEGHLIKMTQVHGRKKSIRTMAEKLGDTILPDSPIFICHADCLGDAEALRSILKEEYGKEVTLISGIGSVIGAHSGPGTLALFFIGTHR